MMTTKMIDSWHEFISLYQKLPAVRKIKNELKNCT